MTTLRGVCSVLALVVGVIAVWRNLRLRRQVDAFEAALRGERQQRREEDERAH